MAVDYNNSLMLMFPSGTKVAKSYSQKRIDGSDDFTFDRNAVKHITNINGVLEGIAIDELPLDYAYSNSLPQVVPPKFHPTFLIEGTATNIQIRSIEFDNAAWNKSSGVFSVSANVATAPDGTMTADKVIETNATSFRRLRDSNSYTSGLQYTYSIYMKVDQRDFLFLEFNTSAFPTNAHCWFDLTNETTNIGAGGDDAYFEILSNGWMRCVLIATADATTTAETAFYMSDNGSSVNYLGDGTSGSFFWNAQVEQGDKATSPIITSGSTVTRLADIATVTPPVGTTSIIETIDGVEQTPITVIPPTYQLPVGNINSVAME